MVNGLLIISLFFNLHSSKATEFIHCNNPEKVIAISVNEKGVAIIGPDTLLPEQLTAEVQKRLWKSYLGTGKMYDAIQLDIAAGTQTAMIIAVRNAIGEAQKKALINICLQKHKKLFADLSDSKQNKIRSQFPVLFQKNY